MSRKHTTTSTPLERLLYSREQAAEQLGGVSTDTVRRLERQGRLKPVRLTGSRTGKVFYRAEQVHALIEQPDDR
jgi:hypothetical protein